tara:strand:+ start:435 stop:671 length:237 start_codon:yes stop_codon:yes gene_type:complete
MNMLTNGMVLNGVLQVLEKARVTNYDPNDAIEELALALATVAQMTQVPIAEAMVILQNCADVQDSAQHYVSSQLAAEA